MMELPDGRKSFKIGLVVLIQYRSVTDTHPASQPASHVAVTNTRNAYRCIAPRTSHILIIKIILVLVLVSFQSNHFYFI